MLTALQLWLHQIESLIIHKYHTISPQDYCIMLLICGAVGLTLLYTKHS